MGIHNFNKWLLNNHPDIFTHINKKEYDNVFIDLNPLLHVAISKHPKDSKDLINKICFLINKILEHIVPTKRLIFSTDGIPSFAKMILQRERRKNMMKNTEITNQTNFINPIIFTPGTEFMNNLANNLDEYFNKLKQQYNNKIKIIELISMEYDESELKLFNKMKKYKKDNNIIVSNDADVIVIALSITNTKSNINVCNIKNNIYQEISMNKFLNNLLTNNDKTNLDYVLLMLLMGNDYIPKVNYINLNKLMQVFSKIKTKLVIKDNNQYIIDNKTFAKLIFRTSSKKIKINSICELKTKKIHNYVQGLIWCLNNYYNGYTQNMFYMYNYNKLGIKPEELYYYLRINHKIKVLYPLSNTHIMKPTINIYPAIVLPYKNKFLVKNNYCDYLLKNHSEFYSEELCKTCIEYSKKISDLHITLKYIKDMNDSDENYDQLKKDINKNNMEYHKHKKHIHKRIKYNKFIEIINELITV